LIQPPAPLRARIRLQILGPLRLWRDGAELAPGPRQQAFVLAVLLARVGQPVSRAELIDLLWGQEMPASALNVMHKYVGSLRRLLEPGLTVREAGSYLQRCGEGYLFDCGTCELDLVTFRRLVEAGRTAAADGEQQAALDRFPATVRDVVRTRTADLEESALDLLQVAALIGRQVRSLHRPRAPIRQPLSRPSGRPPAHRALVPRAHATTTGHGR